MMPLIFLVSGASIFYATRKSIVTAFARDKAMRLLVPAVVGVFTASVIQVYVERVSHGQLTGSFAKFLPHYFDGLYVPGGAGNFGFAGMHLWYLLALFVQTRGIVLLALPTIALRNLTDTGVLGGALAVGSWRPIHYV